MGEWVHDKAHGKGVYKWPNGDMYEGMFINNMAQGKGIKTWADGRRYMGDWVHDKANGQGVYSSLNGDRYEGAWVNGAQHGKGTLTRKDGRKYVGDWVHDKCTEHGVLTWPNGDTYDGDWMEDKRHGREPMLEPMAVSTLAVGYMTSAVGKASPHGPTVMSTRARLSTTWRMARARRLGLMVVGTTVIGVVISALGTVPSSWQTGTFTTVIG